MLTRSFQGGKIQGPIPGLDGQCTVPFRIEVRF